MKVIQIGNPILRQKAKEISGVNSKEVEEIIANLVNSLRKCGLVGMAAPQIGKSLRIFVTEIRPTPTRNPNQIDSLRVFINPEIVWGSEKKVVIYEGCGSVINGKLYGPVKRSEKIKIKALNEKGKEFELKAEGLLARVIQHENDHLNGILFTDKLDDVEKLMSRDEYLKRMV